MGKYIYTYIGIHMHTYIYTYMCVYTHTHTHTYTHTNGQISHKLKKKPRWLKVSRSAFLYWFVLVLRAESNFFSLPPKWQTRFHLLFNISFLCSELNYVQCKGSAGFHGSVDMGKWFFAWKVLLMRSSHLLSSHSSLVYISPYLISHWSCSGEGINSFSKLEWHKCQAGPTLINQSIPSSSYLFLLIMFSGKFSMS